METIYESDVFFFNFLEQYFKKTLLEKGKQLVKKFVFRNNGAQKFDRGYVSIFSFPFSEFPYPSPFSNGK